MGNSESSSPSLSNIKTEQEIVCDLWLNGKKVTFTPKKEEKGKIPIKKCPPANICNGMSKPVWTKEGRWDCPSPPTSCSKGYTPLEIPIPNSKRVMHTCDATSCNKGYVLSEIPIPNSKQVIHTCKKKEKFGNQDYYDVEPFEGFKN
jgi:hypothetical protein